MEIGEYAIVILTKFKVTYIDEKAKESNGMSSSPKRRHSNDSGPGAKSRFFSLAKKITYVCIQTRSRHL